MTKGRKNPSIQLEEKFSDGWDFSPDAGNMYTRAEVFTPKRVVDMMIHDANLFCDEAVYKRNYSTLSDERTLAVISSTVLESALGTGNFLSEILWHKLSYAAELSSRNPDYAYDTLVVSAVSSIYANDIDSGTLQTAKSRILFGDKINSDKNLAFWVSQYENSVPESERIDPRSTFASSLKTADEKWGEFLKNEGVISKQYLSHAGRNVPEALKETLEDIVDSNFLLFDSISENPLEAVPGWGSIVWQIHEVDDSSGSIVVSQTPIAFALQVGLAELETMKQVRDSAETEKERKLFTGRISRLRAKLETLPGAGVFLQ